MIVWLSVAAIILALAVVAFGKFYVRSRRGEIERADVVAAGVLIAVAVLLVVLSELVVQEISALVFFLWLPLWFFWYSRRHGKHV
jgi:4-amino-4-deoxy-L-arabinose transferase-like glycosyltransferase